MGRETTVLEREQIATMYANGATFTEIQKATGRTGRVVERALKEFGIPLKKPRFKTAEHETIAARYLAGESMASIWHSTDRSPNYIWRALELCGVARRPDDWWMIPDAERQELVKAYQGGETFRAIKNRTGRDIAGIRRMCEVAGVDIGLRGGLNKSRAHRKYQINENYFASIDTERKAWMLGFFTADGCVSKNRLDFGLAWKDRDTLQMIADELECNAPVRRRIDTCKGKKYPTCTLAVSSLRIAIDLASLGIGERKSLTVEAWRGPLDLMPHYWRGLIDGDGCWSTNFQLIGSESIIRTFAIYCRSIIDTIATPRQKTVNGRAWSLSIGGRCQMQKLAAHFYPPETTLALPRKWAIAKQIIAACK